MNDVERALAASRLPALANLIRALGDFDLAEDCLQEALARALPAWRAEGMPAKPVAWVVTVGRRIAVDRFRTRARQAALAADLAGESNEAYDPWQRRDERGLDSAFDDDVLRLLFTTCHPAIATEAQLGLALRIIGGFSLEEVGRALLISEQAAEQRLLRAKRKIRNAGIAYEVPPPGQLAERLPPVLRILYLLFNEGYCPTHSAHSIRDNLCEEALRLTRQLARVFPAQTETQGLLALMLLHMARSEARFDRDGALVPIEAQDRRLWDRARISEADKILETALRKHRPGPYQIQAAIAACHCAAVDAAATDWPQILGLYEYLYRHEPSPVVKVNHAAACIQAGALDQAEQILADVVSDPMLADYAALEATLAALAERKGKLDAARARYLRAIAITRNPSEIQYLTSKIAALSQPPVLPADQSPLRTPHRFQKARHGEGRPSQS